RGALTAHTSDLTHVVDVLADFRPTLLVAVPRVFEKVYNAAARTTGVRAAAFRVAERVALAHSHARDTGGPGVALRAAWWVFDRLVYGRLREVLGGRVRYAVSGGAPLGGGLAHFLRGAGITVLEGWGLTETTAGVTFNLPRAQRIGTVGRPLPGCAVRVAADGEVLVHGSTVFHGYWPDTTRDPDTWFHTGDLGALDDDGYLTIVGRGKDLIVTASGKNIAPEFFEGRLRAHWLVDQCVLVGDGRPYVGALFTLDPVSFAEWKSRAGRPFDATIAELRSDAQLNAVLQRAVDEVNRVVSRAEAIKRFRILADEFDVGDELTTTQNVRRNHVLAKFGTDVEALYHRPETS
ncbi:MAG TPA: AMP-binding protein, partial [Pseudonocardiaceae bacterium]|nr:AMP-binding protein [Pseudonocardiaceae bacterium]